VASLIKEEVGAMIIREYRDRSIGFITVTDVQMTPDLRIAKIYVSIFGNEQVKEQTMEFLEEEKPHIRSFLGSHVRLKFTPSLQFYIDDTLDRVEKINNLLKQSHAKDNEKP
jgi:ribosome-binding factor A